MTEREETPADRYLVPGLVRGLEALRAFSAERPRLTLGEMAEALGVTRSAVFRIAYTLQELGFLTHDPRSRSYALGPEVLRLGYGYLASRDLVEVATPHLEALRDRTQWTAHLGVLEGTEVLYLARVTSRRALASMVQVGARLPAHATTMGRALLAALPEARVREIYEGRDLPAHTPRTPASPDALIARLRRDRARGWVAHVAGYEAGVASVAAPVRDVTGEVVAAVNISGAASQATEAELEGPLAAAVVATASALSAALGHAAEGKAVSPRP